MASLTGKKRGKVTRLSKTKEEVVASGLRQAIITGRLKGGQRLHQGEIAAEFKVSRIPVREALRALHAQGLVTFHPRRGAVVTSLSADEFVEVFEVRGVLEELAVKYAVTNLSAEDLKRLRKLVDEMDSVLGDPVGYFQRNDEFHNIINSAAERKRLLDMINTLRTATQHYLWSVVMNPESMVRAQAQHRELLDALGRKDTAAAQLIIRRHLLGGAKFLARYFRHNLL